MREVPIRLGPLALLLTVLSICMTTLGILAFTTARADLSLAEKYADTVRSRYAREAEGMEFLRDVREDLASGTDAADLEGRDEDGVIRKRIGDENRGLSIGLRVREDGSLEIVSWRLENRWEEAPVPGNLWSGE
ncbi:MAG: hypothetical protein HFI93_07615 [Lachnospiraceae bacterium]|nr:hypothetical protein [Lachnospiraceae bacterium]